MTTPVAEKYVGRFAPSPTGPLHFGSLLAATASYADALAHQGRWLVRMEDVDEPRSQPMAAAHILQTLTAYGFRWDGEVVVQSERKGFYENALETLASSGALFACTCTRKMLENHPQNVSGERLYLGTCCAHTLGLPPAAGEGWGGGGELAVFLSVGVALKQADLESVKSEAAPPLPQPGGGSGIAVRIQVPNETISWHDQHLGAQSQHLATEVGAFIVKRSDGLFAYQLAVVVDDAAQGMTHIVRGADLLSSTARQIYLQRLLRLPVPSYLHIPVAVNGRGEKLSKQTLAPALGVDAPLATLLVAWRALNQISPTSATTLPEFWAHCARAWSVARLPRTLTLSA